MPSIRVLDATLAGQLLAIVSASSVGVVVFERLPRAAGETRWFLCETSAELRWVLDRLKPASFASFYLDGCIAKRTVDGALRREVSSLLAEDREVVLGTVSAMMATVGCRRLSLGTVTGGRAISSL